MRLRFLAVLLATLTIASAAEARALKIATWNLGWHLSKTEAATWISKCDAPFAKDDASGIWKPAQAGTPGWQLTWGRDAKIEWDISTWPPCNVYQVNFDTVAVTMVAYERRLGQLQSFFTDVIKADVIAFQEVSGEQAVRDVLPNSGADYNICSFTTHKVQRLAFAWKKELGAAVSCETENPMSLPHVGAKDQVRPGLALELRIDNKNLRFLAVHLKSSCVSPLEGMKGKLSGANEACTFLQQQVVPLEAWIERNAAQTRRFVVLGDFNRNLWHERVDETPVRTDGSFPKDPLPAGAKVQSLIEEIDDNAPPSSLFVLLHETCSVNPFTELTCAEAEKGRLPPGDERMLKHAENLGCEFPIGLDHILVGTGFAVTDNAYKVPLGKQGRTLPKSASNPDPLLALSDHCPTVTTLELE